MLYCTASRRAWVSAVTWIVVLVGAGLAEAEGPAARTSRLWGERGELWRPDSRLPDFSYAGYHRGERKLPDRRATVSVKAFGARGDGKTDDTKAFQRAIAAAPGKVIAVLAGRYVITDFLTIRSSGTCLKGAGPDKSVLYFPTPLNEIKPNWGATTTGRRTSNYSWSGGFVSVAGLPSRQVMATVTAGARRGERALTVSTLSPFRPGQDVRLVMSDTPAQTLATHLYAGDPGPLKNLGTKAGESLAVRITGGDGRNRRIEFDRPLRTDVRAEWKPTIYAASSSVEEVGIEDLAFEFPVTPYKGHFTELGYNAIAMRGCRNCWVRNVRIAHADSGLFISGTNITMRDIVWESDRQVERHRKATGHHGVTLGGQDNLLERFEFRTRFMHDITVTNRSAGNVAADGSGPDICFDHHCYACRANLFTNIDLGEGSRMFQSGGGAALGRHSGAWETFWCIRARRGQEWPAGWGPEMMNLVGVQTAQGSTTDPDGRWFEAIDPNALEPANLYQAQLQRRLGRKP